MGDWRTILFWTAGILCMVIGGVLESLLIYQIVEWMRRRLHRPFKPSPPTAPPDSAKLWDGQDRQHHRVAYGFSIAAGILGVAGVIAIALVLFGLDPLWLWGGFGAIGLAAATLGVIFGTSDRDFYF